MTPRDRAKQLADWLRRGAEDAACDHGDFMCAACYDMMVERKVEAAITEAIAISDIHTDCGMCGKSIESNVYVRLNDKYVHQSCHVEGIVAECEANSVANSRAMSTCLRERDEALQRCDYYKEDRERIANHGADLLGKERARAEKAEAAHHNAEVDYTNTRAREVTALRRIAKPEAALARIVDTDTHGKNVPDKSGTMRPTGNDFCGRCNRNSYWPHADDCPITLASAALSAPAQPATAAKPRSSPLRTTSTAARCCQCLGRHDHPIDGKGCYFCVEHYPDLSDPAQPTTKCKCGHDRLRHRVGDDGKIMTGECNACDCKAGDYSSNRETERVIEAARAVRTASQMISGASKQMWELYASVDDLNAREGK